METLPPDFMRQIFNTFYIMSKQREMTCKTTHKVNAFLDFHQHFSTTQQWTENTLLHGSDTANGGKFLTIEITSLTR